MPSSEQPTSSDSAEQFTELLVEADEAFLTHAHQRLQKGAEKYGPLKFLSVDTLQEAMDEVADLANYARMTYAKLYLLQAAINKQVAKHPATDAQGFVSMKELFTK